MSGRGFAAAAFAAGMLLMAGCWIRGCDVGIPAVWGPRFSGPQPTPAPRPDPIWMSCHAEHVDIIKQADQEGQGFDLLFYGDSITETWHGTDLCHPIARAQGVHDVFLRHYSKFNGGVMAEGGDQTAHLLWRLRNGEAPAVNKPKVAVLLIGTNDLGSAAMDAPDVHTAEGAVMRAVPGVTLRVLQTLHTLKELMPDTHVVLLALLPRGGGYPSRGYHWPSVFTEAFEMVNLHFRDYTRLDGHLHFLDCGDRFLAPDGRSIRADFMPDALHPNAAGYELLAECLDPLVTKLMQRANDTSAAGASAAAGASTAAGLQERAQPGVQMA